MLDLISTFSNLVIAVFAVVTGVLTWVLAIENRRLRRAGTEPEVVAYLIPHADGTGAINFVLANIGQGPAMDVQFELTGDASDFEAHEVLLSNDPTRSAISVLPQGEKIAALFGVSFRLFKGPDEGSQHRLRPFTVSIRYRNVAGKPRSAIQRIDVSQFAGLRGMLAKPTERRIADALEKIERHLRSIVRGRHLEGAEVDSTSFDESQRERVIAKSVEHGDGQ